MTTRPALTVIDGGRAHEPARAMRQEARTASPPEVLEFARALARRDHAAMMAAMQTDSQTNRLTIATSVEAAILKR